MDDNDANFTLIKWACMPLWCRKYSNYYVRNIQENKRKFWKVQFYPHGIYCIYVMYIYDIYIIERISWSCTDPNQFLLWQVKRGRTITLDVCKPVRPLGRKGNKLIQPQESNKYAQPELNKTPHIHARMISISALDFKPHNVNSDHKLFLVCM